MAGHRSGGRERWTRVPAIPGQWEVTGLAARAGPAASRIYAQTQSAAHRAGSASRVVAVEPSGCALPLWDSARGCIQTRLVWRHGPAQQLGVAVVFKQFDLLPVSRFPVFTLEPIPKSQLLFALRPLPT